MGLMSNGFGHDTDPTRFEMFTRLRPLKPVRSRFWGECALALISGNLAVLTLLWPNWIELVLGVEPDGGDGSLERVLVGLCVGATVAFSALARTEWRRARVQPVAD